MNYALENEKLKVEVSDHGAELQSIKGKKSGFEYLWQGTAPFWASRASVLFPTCGRLFEKKYTFNGKTFEMNLHGFARHSVFTVEKHEKDKVVFVLSANEETKKCYPFDFTFRVIFTLDESKLTVTYEVVNEKEEILPFSLGSHPGFNVPMQNCGEYTDYYLEFSEKCSPEKMIISIPSYLSSGKHVAFPLENGRILRLRHDLFDNDAIFLRNTSNAVTLKSDKCDATVTVSFSDMGYVGFWHNPETEAPFVCIEPWHGLPGRDGVIEDFSNKPLMIQLEKGKTYSNYYAIEITE